MRDRVVLGLLVGCGLRRQELADLRCSDVVRQPFEGKVCTVLSARAKGDKHRTIPLQVELADLLNEWAEWTGREGYIARSLGMDQRLGDSLGALGVFRIVRKHGAMIGLPELAAHDLRRTFAQQSTHDPLLARALLGHSSVATAIATAGGTCVADPLAFDGAIGA
jgi:integrase